MAQPRRSGWVVLAMHTVVVLVTVLGSYVGRRTSVSGVEVISDQLLVFGTFLVGAISIRRTGRLPGMLFVMDGVVAGIWIATLIESGETTVVAHLLLTNVAVVGFALHSTRMRFAALSAAAVSVGVLGASVVTQNGTIVTLGVSHLASVVTLIGVVQLWQGALNVAAEKMSRLVDGLEAVVWEEIADSDGSVLVSGQAEKMFGWPIENWAEPHWWESCVHPDDVEESRVGRGIEGDFQFRFLNAGGQYRWVENRIRSVADDRGKHLYFRGVIIDRTSQVDAELRSKRFSAIVEHSTSAHWIFHRDSGGLSVVDSNGAAHTLLARIPTETGTADVVEMLRSATPPIGIDEVISECLATGESFEVDEIDALDGRSYDIQVEPLDATGASLSLEDVTGRVDSRRLLYHQAHHDELTGLPNRAMLTSYLSGLLEAGSSDGLALLMLDLDQFKEVNDSLGHQVGDRLLVQVARRLSRCVGGRGLVARLGGDEFAIVLDGADAAEASEVAIQIEATLDDIVVIDGLAVKTGASIGVALTPDHADELGGLMRRADVAMYTAKRRHLGHSLYDPATDVHTVERVALHADLSTAIKDGQIKLWFQPVMDVATRRVTGVEGLARWDHPELGVLTPDRFLELVVVSGQIGLLTRSVISQALAFGHRLASAGIDNWVSVNMSALDLHDHTLIDWIDGQLDVVGMPPGGICLEVTESEVMEDPAAALATMTALVDRGFSTAIDDFGTGFSSMSQLDNLPVSHLKIDRSFVSALGSDPAEHLLVRSMTELGHNLGMKVVAEGCETEANLGALRELRCDLAQGYLFSRPVPADELLELIGGAAPKLRPQRQGEQIVRSFAR